VVAEKAPRPPSDADPNQEPRLGASGEVAR
jgi:hypothetical protein